MYIISASPHGAEKEAENMTNYRMVDGVVAVVEVTGPIGSDTSTQTMGVISKALSEPGAQHLVLDLTNAQYQDDEAIGELCAAYKMVKDKQCNGRVVLLNPDERTKKHLHTTRLEEWIECAQGNLEETLKTFD